MGMLAPHMRRPLRVTPAVALLALVGGASLSLTCDRAPARPPAPDRAPTPVPVAPPSSVPSVTPSPPAAKKIQHPIAVPRSAVSLPALAASDGYAARALSRLLGRKAVLAHLGLDGFVRNFVATVDNLAGKRAPSLAWPVKTTPGRFITEGAGRAAVIGADNAARYAPFVQLASAVDVPRAVALYVRMYPLFQQAWAELGPSGTYFNDRVVDVIDDLLATPDVAQPLHVRRAEVPSGARAPALYVFEDPALEARSAGQKILLRMGRANAEALKAKLIEVRALIAKGRTPRRP
jgi:hypothetical protein